ncbi:MAG: HAD family hydrolase [Clostridia bacterium]|nr:HAD family hydrolase [Clostridia bacterium]
MGIFDGVYLACDLDGTLLCSKGKTVSEENAFAIKEFIREGGVFGFATGRASNEIEKFNAGIGSKGICITCNGSTLYDLGTKEHTLLAEAEDDILPFYEYTEREFPEIMFEIVSSDNIIYYYRPNPALDKHRSITNADFCEVGHYTEVPRPWVKLALWAVPEETKRFASEADRSILPDRYNFMHSFEYCCEISRKSADKGTGLLAVKKKLKGINLTCAIGDNENDVTMLKNADISFVPQNAVPMAKENAKYILSRDCNHSAVAEAIEKLRDIIKK